MQHTVFGLLALAVVLAAGCAHDKNAKSEPTPEQIMSTPDARLRSIILTKVALTNATIEATCRYLTDQSREADPDKEGVQIAFRTFQLNSVPWHVNLSLPQATVYQALEEVCRQTKCCYLIEKDKITVLPEQYLKQLGPGFYRVR